MEWERIDFDRPLKSELNKYLGEVQFYVDHSVDDALIEILRWLKHNVETAKDLGAESQRDEWHFKRAFDTKRVLIAQDKD